MAHRRISSAEKGKGVDLASQQPTRAARVKVPLPDNSELLRKHSLTLIGRVTNKTAQKAEITSLTARMRVHVNGLLPLITTSVVEYPNGDEVITNLVYERLDKHCTKCLRLDHELKECLVARAEIKALKAKQEEEGDRTKHNPIQGSDSARGFSTDRAQSNQVLRPNENRRQEAFHFSASNNYSGREERHDKEGRGKPQHRAYKTQSKSWQERGSYRRSQPIQERARYENERSSRPPRGEYKQRDLPGPPRRSFYREVPKPGKEPMDSSSSISKNDHGIDTRGIPSYHEPEIIPQDMLIEARGEVRDMMLQYAQNADPTEREARKERIRRADESGELEKDAIQLAKNALASCAAEMRVQEPYVTPERIPASQRLGPTVQLDGTSSGRTGTDQHQPTRGRIPATLRLGDNSTSPLNKERIPAVHRLSEAPIEDPPANPAETAIVKRKPGRPPGRGKIQASPNLSIGTSTKRRKEKTKS
ncbi:hypothetical protein IGI04_018519 [Brassica rapa subsp. trilocularis]|uniref:Zinc knuckle CX2CX4HX4C domain-containing protein n=1 Tax=Brassica rapa subsp. trilocularis TaxID=1813537 RepID=A0ABQ7MDA4_BRACM|nr:hypothetical protein IGI04_018519 [Brassica rapa subsp. trilocularis]